jgi:hypothetical protein
MVGGQRFVADNVGDLRGRIRTLAQKPGRLDRNSRSGVRGCPGVYVGLSTIGDSDTYQGAGFACRLNTPGAGMDLGEEISECDCKPVPIFVVVVFCAFHASGFF